METCKELNRGRKENAISSPERKVDGEIWKVDTLHNINYEPSCRITFILLLSISREGDGINSPNSLLLYFFYEFLSESDTLIFKRHFLLLLKVFISGLNKGC